METLIGKEVEVGVIGLVYAGKLVEVTEAEVHLESETGWLAIPAAQVLFIREKAGGEFSPIFEF